MSTWSCIATSESDTPPGWTWRLIWSISNGGELAKDIPSAHVISDQLVYLAFHAAKDGLASLKALVDIALLVDRHRDMLPVDAS